MLAHAWSWLSVHGTQDLLAAAVGGVVTRALGWRPRQHARAQAEQAAHLAKIADQLDTSTPGGLADVVAAKGKEG